MESFIFVLETFETCMVSNASNKSQKASNYFLVVSKVSNVLDVFGLARLLHPSLMTNTVFGKAALLLSRGSGMPVGPYIYRERGREITMRINVYI